MPAEQSAARQQSNDQNIREVWHAVIRFETDMFIHLTFCEGTLQLPRQQADEPNTLDGRRSHSLH